MKDRYTDEELKYAATSRCVCGAGLAYPRDHDDAMELQAWVCSRVMRGDVTLAERPTQKGIGPAVGKDDAGQEHQSFAFWCYEIKSEDQPSAGGMTTRPKSDAGVSE